MELITSHSQTSVTYCGSLCLNICNKKYLVTAIQKQLHHFASYASYIMGLSSAQPLIKTKNNVTMIHPFLVFKLLLLDDRTTMYLGDKFAQLLLSCIHNGKRTCHKNILPDKWKQPFFIAFDNLSPFNDDNGYSLKANHNNNHNESFTQMEIFGIHVELDTTHQYFNLTKLHNELTTIDNSRIDDWIEVVPLIGKAKYMTCSNDKYVHVAFLLGVLSFSEPTVVQMSIHFQSHWMITNVIQNIQLTARQLIELDELILPLITKTKNISGTKCFKLCVSDRAKEKGKFTSSSSRSFSHLQYIHPSNIFSVLFQSPNDQAISVSKMFFHYLNWFLHLEINNSTDMRIVSSQNNVTTVNILGIDVDIIVKSNGVFTNYFDLNKLLATIGAEPDNKPLTYIDSFCKEINFKTGIAYDRKAPKLNNLMSNDPMIANSPSSNLSSSNPMSDNECVCRLIVDNDYVTCCHLILLLKVMHTFSSLDQVQSIGKLLMYQYKSKESKLVSNIEHYFALEY